MSTTAPEVEGIVRAVEHYPEHLLLLLTGFDGVLIEYDADPAVVRLSSSLRALLAGLSGRSDVAVGIVSGRRVSDLKRRAELPDNVFYVGLHGLEIEGPHFTRIDRHTYERCRNRLHDVVSTLTPAMASIAGIRIEDKGAAIAVHTREAGPVDTVWARIRLLNTAADLISSQEMRVVRGNHVFELVPNVVHPKAAAIRAIRQDLEKRHARGVFTVYIGEDLAEDDAYQAVEGCGVAAVVGRRAPWADYHLASPAVVEQLIGSLGGMSRAAAWRRRNNLPF